MSNSSSAQRPPPPEQQSGAAFNPEEATRANEKRVLMLRKAQRVFGCERAKTQAEVWKDLSGEMSWFGSSSDDDVCPNDPTEPGEWPKTVCRVHLSASRTCAWLGLCPDTDGAHCVGSSTGRQRLYNEWNEPRRRACTGRPNQRLERGKQHEPKAREHFASVSGLELGVDITRATLAEHPEHTYIAAKTDGLIGDDGVLEIKTPWASRKDEDAPVHLEVGHLLQVHTQLQCTGRNYAIVVMTAVDGTWLHVWKVLRDRAEYHLAAHGEKPLWETALPEYQKYQLAVDNGGQVDPAHGGITAHTQYCIRRALWRWRHQAVFRLAMAEPTPGLRIGPLPGPLKLLGWARACTEGCNRPSFTHIDGVQVVMNTLCVRRFARVWWRYDHSDDAEPKVYIPDPDKPSTSGGYIRAQYYHAVLVPQSLSRRDLWL